MRSPLINFAMPIDPKPDEASTSLLDSAASNMAPGLARRSRYNLRYSFLVGLSVATLIAISILLGATIGVNARQGDLDEVCLRHTSWECRSSSPGVLLRMTDCSSAPLTPDVHISWKSIQFNGSLLKETPFRQSAGPEVDTAWESLGVNCELHGFSYVEMLLTLI